MAESVKLNVGVKGNFTELDSQIKAYDGKKTITVKTALSGGGTKEVTKYNTALGETVSVTEKFNKSGASTGAVISRISNNSGVASTKIGQLGKDFLDTTGKVLKFGASTAIIGLFTAACSAAVTAVKELDDSLTEFKKVSDLNGDSLQDYVDKLTQMGQLTGSTAKQMVDAATEFKKSGYSDDDSAKLAQVAELYMNIADEQISAGDSASFIISQMKAFNITANDSLHIINAVNEVSNQYSVSSADLADNIGKISATLAASGNSYEEALGMLTAITEITRNASTASRGLKQISSRLVQTVDETSATGQKLATIYTKLGISLKDSNGQLRSTYDILNDLSGKWGTLSTDQKNYIALTSAGSNQIQNFLALMSNFNTAVTATSTAYNSSGSAMKENAKAMDSLDKRLNLLKSAFDSMVNEGGSLNSFFKLVVSGATAILKFVNNTGLIQVAMVALAGVMTSKVITGVQTFSAYIIRMITTFQNARAESKVFSVGLTEVGATATTTATGMQLLNIAIAGVTAAVSLGIIAYSLYTSKQKEAKQAREDSIKSSEDEISSLEDAEAQLKSESLTREDLDKIVASNLSSYTDEIAKIKDLNTARQTAIDKIEEQKKAEAQNIVDTGLTDYESALSRQKSSKTSGFTAWTNLNIEQTPNKSVQSAISGIRDAKGTSDRIESFKNYKDVLVDVRSELKNGTTEYNIYAKEISRAESEISKLEKTQQEDNSTITQMNQALSETGQYYDEATGQVKDLSEAQENNRTSISETTDAMNDNTDAASDNSDAMSLTDEELEDLAKSVKMSSEELTAFADSMGLSVQQAADYQSAMNDMNSSFDSIQSAYATLTAYADEYNKGNGITIDTMQAVLPLLTEYGADIEVVNGKLVINQKAIRDKVTAQAEEAKQTIYNTAIGKLNDIMNQSNKKTTDDLATSKSSSAADIDKQTTALSKNNYQMAVNKALASDNGDNADAVKDVETWVKNAVGAINTMVDGMGKNFSGTMGASSDKASKSAESAAKKAADAAEKAYKEAAEQKQKFIENQYKTGKISEEEYLKELYALNETYYGKLSGKGSKYLEEYEKNQQSIYSGMKDMAKESVEATEKSMDAQIKAIGKAEDAALDAIDKQIDAIKDAEDAALKSIENQIDALKDEKEDVISGIEDQIDAVNKQKDAEDKYWDDRIDKLKSANTELDNQNELMEAQEALAQAKQTKNMVLGTSGKFEYQQDESAVASAEQNVSDIQDKQDYESQLQALEDFKAAADENYEAQIESLNDLKVAKEDWYDEQISDLEDYKDSVQEQYDAQIEQMEDYKELVQEQFDAQKEALQSQLDNYKDHEDQMIAKQVDAIQTRAANWQTDLNNLQSYVNSYNAMMASLGEAGATVSSSYKATSATTSTASSSKKTTTAKHAKGVASVKSDEVALVGDNPNYQELVVGSKLNGTLMNISTDSGVVNAQSTKTLSGLLNTLGSTLGLSNYSTVNSSNTKSTNINISNLNVTSNNGEELVTYLQNFGMQMTQESYA